MHYVFTVYQLKHYFTAENFFLYYLFVLYLLFLALTLLLIFHFQESLWKLMENRLEPSSPYSDQVWVQENSIAFPRYFSNR